MSQAWSFEIFIMVFFNPNLYFRLLKWIKKIRPDIIHVHNNGKFASSVLLAIKNSNLPAIQTVHDPSIICSSSMCVNLQGEVCDGGLSIKCVKNGCISWFKYLYEKIPLYLRNNLIKRNIKLFLVPSTALKDRLVKNGLVMPNTFLILLMQRNF